MIHKNIISTYPIYGGSVYLPVSIAEADAVSIGLATTSVFLTFLVLFRGFFAAFFEGPGPPGFILLLYVDSLDASSAASL